MDAFQDAARVFGDKVEYTHCFEEVRNVTMRFVDAPPRPRARLINGVIRGCDGRGKKASEKARTAGSVIR